MPKYKPSKAVKKPVQIEYLVWTGKNIASINDFLNKDYFINNYNELIIKTLEGNIKASVGDHIIKGVNGEFYPCKPDIFKKTYDRINDE